MRSKYLTQTPSIADFEKNGYLVIQVSDEVVNCINLIFDIASKFYRNNKSIKRLSSLPHLSEGWKDLGGEFSEVPERPDLHESFWVTQKYHKSVSCAYTEEGLQLYNEMYKCISFYNNIERSLTEQLLKYYHFYDIVPQFKCDHDSDMQILYYQPYMHDRDLLQEPHDDSLYMTFAKATKPGLEILLQDGQYHQANLGRNEILIMPGEILSLMTGYMIKPLIHKVVRHAGQKDRFSLGYFTLPNIKQEEKIIPWIINDKNRNIDVMNRVIYNQNKFLVK